MKAEWFDQPANNPGTLVSRLAADAQLVNGLTSNVIGLTLSSVGSMITGVTIAFIYSWQLTLVVLAFFPLMVLVGIFQGRRVEGFADKTDEAYKDSGKFTQEAVTNIRTVRSFGHDQNLIKLLDVKLMKPFKLIPFKSHMAGLAFGFSQLIMFSVNGLVFYIGALFINDPNVALTPTNLFICMFAVLMAAQAVG